MPLSPRVPSLAAMELILAVARSGSLAAAARTVGVSQQAASQRMRSVEAQTGLSLLERSRRGSSLTPNGILVAQWCSRVLDAAHEVESGIGALRSDATAQLRVRASFTIAEHLLPGWLIELSAGHPLGAVELRSRNSDEVLADVRAGTADVGFIESTAIPGGVRRAVVGHDRLVLVVPPGHPWARRTAPVPARLLAATPLVAREPGSGTRQAYAAAVHTALGGNTEIADPALELDSTAAIRTAVAAGVAPAVISELAISDDLRLGHLRLVKVRDLDLRRPLHAIWVGAERPPTGLARELVELAVRSGRRG